MIRTLAILALAALAPITWAQSINIDFAHPGQGPSGRYAAAGLPGEWNVIEAVDPQIEYSLFDLYGQPTSVVVDQFGGTEILDAALGAPGDPDGNDRAVLKDALITHTNIETCLFFNGFEPGVYEVITYAWMPDEPTIQSNVHVDTNPLFTRVGGAWPGEQRERVTYARHIVETLGFLGPHSGVPPGGDFGIGAALNAMQIRKLGPEPPLFVSRDAISWLSALNASSYDVLRGDLELLRSTDGDFMSATESCLVDNSIPTSLPYTEDPPAAGGHWFLARADGMTWDSPGSSQAGSRDGGIGAAPESCQ